MFFHFYSFQHNFRQTRDKIPGLKKQARFGFSVAAMGDVNKDGFNGRCSLSDLWTRKQKFTKISVTRLYIC